MSTTKPPSALTDEQIVERLATELMGWKLEVDQWGNRDFCRPFNKIYERIPSTRWNPLTDWNYTMEVVEKLRSIGWWIQLDNECCIGCECCQLSPDLSLEKWDEIEAPEPILIKHEPLKRAICLAALAAMDSLPPL
jgi:hypothetical protein